MYRWNFSQNKPLNSSRLYAIICGNLQFPVSIFTLHWSVLIFLFQIKSNTSKSGVKDVTLDDTDKCFNAYKA